MDDVIMYPKGYEEKYIGGMERFPDTFGYDVDLMDRMEDINGELIPLLMCDFYKVGHPFLYPDDMEFIYETYTCRTTRIPEIPNQTLYGLQGFNKDFLIKYFNEHFFNKPLEEVVRQYELVVITCLMQKPDPSKIIELHKLGYLPLRIMALPEGTSVPNRVPMFTIENTVKGFHWVATGVETALSCEMWPSITVASISKRFKEIQDHWAMKTVGNIEAVRYCGHDFAFRGMQGLSVGAKANGGHLLYYDGTDTVPAIWYMRRMYGGIIKEGGIGSSVWATEHSIQCAFMPPSEDERETYLELMRKIPKGMLSIVGDTKDFWKNMTETLPSIKDEIMAREGKLIQRPDSGDPVLILCGDPNGKTEAERKGLVEVLWDIFGGTYTEKGYKLLDEHIGVIYGDAITLERAEEICKRLAAKGFASINVVLGIGSYSYSYNSRDTFGQAIKSTWAMRGGKEVLMQKDPKTDNGTKKSALGKVIVFRNDEGELEMLDGLSQAEYDANQYRNVMRLVFEDSDMKTMETLAGMRKIARAA